MKTIFAALFCYSFIVVQGYAAENSLISYAAENELLGVKIIPESRVALLYFRNQDDQLSPDVIIDYGQCGIADVKSPYARHYSEALQTIAEKAVYLGNHPGDLIIILAGNYLQDNGVQTICKDILGNRHLQDNLVKLDLSNNRFTDQSLPLLRSVFDSCPKLKTMDISVNYVNFDSFNEVFGNLSGQQKQKVVFSVY
ncbi:MAG: hypothetical protein WCG04_05625 [Alphaproteobacteria bacterium]